MPLNRVPSLAEACRPEGPQKLHDDRTEQDDADERGSDVLAHRPACSSSPTTDGRHRQCQLRGTHPPHLHPAGPPGHPGCLGWIPGEPLRVTRRGWIPRAEAGQGLLVVATASGSSPPSARGWGAPVSTRSERGRVQEVAATRGHGRHGVRTCTRPGLPFDRRFVTVLSPPPSATSPGSWRRSCPSRLRTLSRRRWHRGRHRRRRLRGHRRHPPPGVVGA